VIDSQDPFVIRPSRIWRNSNPRKRDRPRETVKYVGNERLVEIPDIARRVVNGKVKNKNETKDKPSCLSS
jgi:hypothetical protein